MSDLMKEIGRQIKHYRKAKGMTQKELGEKVGCHEGTIRQYENGLREPRMVSKLAIARALDVSYDRLFSLKDGTNLAEVGTDCISRQAAIDALNEYFSRIGKLKRRGLTKGEKAISLDTVGTINSLPSAEPEHTCVNCGRTANNGGWYADGRTRCPIEEHYALPKDGYCHLWEKRNVTDDDYPERRTDE